LKLIFHIFVKIGGPVMCYLNKYTIKSINSPDLIQARNLTSPLIVGLPGETHNGWGF